MKQNTEGFIPFSRPSIGKEEEEAVLKVLRSGWLTTAGETAAFEEEFARYLGVPYALAVNSATAGLHLSLEALNLPPDTPVITTPYTFAATAEVIRYVSCRPVFADIGEDSCNIDPVEIERTAAGLKNAPGAVIPVHIAGEPCRIENILSVTASANIPVIEDAAHALPAVTSRGPAGTVGKTGVFSFYATKNITTGEGGMVVTSEKNMAARMKLMRLHGIDRDIWDRYTGNKKASWYYQVREAGFKYNMGDIAAALGRVQLRKCGEFHKRRKEIAAKYRSALAGLEYLTIPKDTEGHSWHLFIISLKPEYLQISRDDFMERLRDLNIGTSLHFIPLHIMPYYRKKYGYAPSDFPRALRRYQNSLSLPLYPDLTDFEAERVCRAVKAIGDGAYKRYY
ncbi:MAG: DegT/DnrJ/EryC1/StrS family aminotransferase [Spirochaetia bacterium]